ncbi:MAG: class I SAM-dependent methyltransferase [Bacteroidales bacterium]|nr:class I SAM-dependent methyltransferase [Bacteroidales bacterium]
MKKINFILQYIKYLFRAKNKYKIHSPFVYDFITKVIQDKKKYPEQNDIKKIIKSLKKSKQVIEFTDFGYYSYKNLYTNSYKKIGQIAKKSTSSIKYGKLLFRMVKYFNPDSILELGTSLGVSTMFMAKAANNKPVTTIEGCASISEIAQRNFDKLNLNNIKINIGNFDNILPEVLKDLNKLDFVFFDGNHKEKSTINYFNQCLSYINDDTIFIFDDIYWSRGMQKSWAYIKNHKKVSLTLDLFQFGIVFFKKDITKQNIVIRY